MARKYVTGQHLPGATEAPTLHVNASSHPCSCMPMPVTPLMHYSGPCDSRSGASSLKQPMSVPMACAAPGSGRAAVPPTPQPSHCNRLSSCQQPDGSSDGAAMPMHHAYDVSSMAEMLRSSQGTPESIAAVLGSHIALPDRPFLARLMRALVADGHWRTALAVDKALRMLGVRRSTATTNAAIHACCAGGETAKAVRIFRHMPQWGVRRDGASFCSVIAAVAADGEWQQAAQLFNEMCDAGIVASELACTYLITAAGNGGQWRVAESMLLAMCARIPAFRELARRHVEPEPPPMRPEDAALLESLCDRLSGRPRAGPSAQHACHLRRDSSGLVRLQNCIADDPVADPPPPQQQLNSSRSGWTQSSDTMLCCAESLERPPSLLTSSCSSGGIQTAASGLPTAASSLRSSSRKGSLQEAQHAADSTGWPTSPPVPRLRPWTSVHDLDRGSISNSPGPHSQHAQHAAPTIFGANAPSTACCNAVLLAYANERVSPSQRPVMLIHTMLQ
eukprot:jgi/Ulvmu1/7159/UM034_0067.1